MDKMKTINRIKEIIGDYTKYDLSQLNSNTALVEDMGLNSIELINIVSDIEDEFDIEIPVDQIVKFHLFFEIEEYVKNVLRTKGESYGIST